MHALQTSICHFDNCIYNQNCNCWLEWCFVTGSLGNTTHMEYSCYKASDKCYTQQKGNIPRSCHVNCGTHTYLWPVIIETNCIRQLERKLVQPDYLTRLTTIILQIYILTTKHLWGSHRLPSRTWKFPWQCSCGDLVNVPRIVIEVIWTSCGRCLMQSVSDTKVNLG